MQIFYSDEFELPLPEGHRFPMSKYRLLREAVIAHPELSDATLRIPEAARDEDLLRVHTRGYLSRVVDGRLDRGEERQIGFPWSPGLVERSRRSTGGTIGAAQAALAEGTGVNLAGGTHHAFPDRGEGFCVFNDVAVAARSLLASGRIRRVAVVDLDVHQGNGTAAIFAGDPRVFTVSVHGASNFPFRKEQSDLDLALPDGTGDDAFLEAVRNGVRRARDDGHPDLVFYLAGADPYLGDRLGRLAVSQGALADRDEIVMAGFADRGIPVALVMAGGYAKVVEDTVAIHLASVRSAARRADFTPCTTLR